MHCLWDSKSIMEVDRTENIINAVGYEDKNI